MKQITLNINESKFQIFLEFINTLDYVEVDKSNSKFLEELQNSLHQVKLMQEGKLPKQNARDFLNSL